MSGGPKPLSEQAKLLRDGRQAAINSHVEQLRVIYRLKQAAADDSADSCCEPGPAPSEFRPGDLLFDLTRFQVDAYSALLNLGSKYTDKIIADLRSRSPAKRGPAPVVRPALEISGMLGTDATAEFAIENRSKKAVEITFFASEFRADDGGGPFSAPLGFQAAEPAQQPQTDRYLPAGATRRFIMSVRLVAPPFQAGKHYSAAVEIRTDGRCSEELGVRLVITRSGS